MKTTYLTIILLIFFYSSHAQFGPRQLIFEHSGSGGRMIRTADFDNDGDQDAVIAISNFIAWYPNDGLGNFGEPNIIELDMQQVFNLLPTDIDADGNIDLVVSYFDQHKVVWYRNLEGGSFNNQQLIASNFNASGVNSADLDDDGDLDLVLGVTNSSGLYWVENLDGQGDFGPLISITPSLSQARRQRLGDMDGDGDIDIVSNGSNPQISWFENADGQGDFSIQHTIETQGLYENAFDLDDIDGDGDLDIISGKNDELSWRENLDGLGNFGPSTIINSNIEMVSDIHIADLDNDGFLDVLTSTLNDNIIAWYKNIDGLGIFETQQIIETELVFPRSVYAADLDNDGDLDVLTSTVSAQDIGSYWYENLTILGIEEQDSKKVILYPNPTKNTLFVTNENGLQIKKITIYDLLGRLVFEKEKEFYILDITKLATGVLFVHILSKDGTLVKRVLKE